jgi:hypothetical protein
MYAFIVHQSQAVLPSLNVLPQYGTEIIYMALTHGHRPYLGLLEMSELKKKSGSGTS